MFSVNRSDARSCESGTQPTIKFRFGIGHVYAFTISQDVWSGESNDNGAKAVSVCLREREKWKAAKWNTITRDALRTHTNTWAHQIFNHI